MKAVAISAFLGVVVAIPLLLSSRKATVLTGSVQPPRNPQQLDSNFRYDVDDFFTE